MNVETWGSKTTSPHPDVGCHDDPWSLWTYHSALQRITHGQNLTWVSSQIFVHEQVEQNTLFTCSWTVHEQFKFCYFCWTWTVHEHVREKEKNWTESHGISSNGAPQPDDVLKKCGKGENTTLPSASRGFSCSMCSCPLLWAPRVDCTMISCVCCSCMLIVKLVLWPENCTRNLISFVSCSLFACLTLRAQWVWLLTKVSATWWGLLFLSTYLRGLSYLSLASFTLVMHALFLRLRWSYFLSALRWGNTERWGNKPVKSVSLTGFIRRHSCLLWIDKARAKDKMYIWVPVWWKTTN